MPKESLCAKVAKVDGEKILTAANKLDLTDKTLQIQRENPDFLLIPLIREPDANELATLKTQVPNIQLTTHVFAEKIQPEKTLEQTLQTLLPLHLLASLPRALDVVGDIAIIEVPPELEAYKNLLGEAILKTHRNVKVALAKAGKVSGVFRLRDFEFLAGEHRTSTTYKEYGCTYYVNVAKAYFSPRLSHEHQRVAAIVEKGETVADLFAGVGPFAVLIAKLNRDCKVFAIDINPDAVELLEKNARLNRVENRVYPIVGDARQIVDEKLAGTADRAIMNLPESADEFIDVACKAIKPAGGVVHFYGFVRQPDTLENLQQRFRDAVLKSGRRVELFLYAKPVRETAPFECQAVLDAKIV